MREKEMFSGQNMDKMEEMTEMSLSQVSDRKEIEWRLEANESLSPLMDFLNDNLDQDLHKIYETRDDLELFQKLKFWLFGVHKDLLYEGLEKFGLSAEKFEREMITSMVLSTTMERDNLDFILEVMVRNGIVDDLKMEGKIFTLETKNGLLSFSKADENFGYQNEAVETLLRRDNLRGGCHEVSEELLKSNSEYRIMTAICRKNLVEKYYHSVVLVPENKVVDLTENLVISEEDFCNLYDVREKVVFDSMKYGRLKEESKGYDRQDGGLLAPLRVAVLEWMKNGKI